MTDPINTKDITRMLWLCFIYNGTREDLPAEALESLRKFAPTYVTITEDEDGLGRFSATITDDGLRYCRYCASMASMDAYDDRRSDLRKIYNMPGVFW